MSADAVPLAGLGDSCDDSAALAWITGAPLQGLRVDPKVARVRRELQNVLRVRMDAHRAVAATDACFARSRLGRTCSC